MNFRLLAALVTLSLTSGCITSSKPFSRIERVPEQNISVYEKGAHVAVTASNLNLRECPGTNCKIAKVLIQGTLLSVNKRSGKWIEVTQKNDTFTGWVFSRYVEPSLMNTEHSKDDKNDAIFQKQTTQHTESTDHSVNTIQTKKLLLDDSPDTTIAESPIPLLEDIIVQVEEKEGESAKMPKSMPQQEGKISEEFM